MSEARLARRLNGRVVAITGAARGIGLATARSLHRRGALVAIGDIDEEVAKSAAASVAPDVLAVHLDVTTEESFATFISAAEERFGALDVLINNAGIMPIGPLLEEDAALSRRMLDINVSGPLIGMRSALPRMVARGRGHIVNVASVAGKSPVAGGISYAASKAAVISLTESARVEFANTGVNFTCVMPAFTNTELIDGTRGVRLVRNIEPSEVGDAIARAIASPRPDVYIPAVTGPMLAVQSLLGRTVRDWFNHLIKADRAFLDYDREARSRYGARIATTNRTPPGEGAGDHDRPIHPHRSAEWS